MIAIWLIKKTKSILNRDFYFEGKLNQINGTKTIPLAHFQNQNTKISVKYLSIKKNRSDWEK